MTADRSSADRDGADAETEVLTAQQRLRKQIREERFAARVLHAEFLGARAQSDLDAMLRIAERRSALMRQIDAMTAELRGMLAPHRDHEREE